MRTRMDVGVRRGKEGMVQVRATMGMILTRYLHHLDYTRRTTTWGSRMYDPHLRHEIVLRWRCCEEGARQATMNFSESESIFYRGRAKFMKGTGDEVGDLTVRGCLCLCMCALYDHLTRTTHPHPPFLHSPPHRSHPLACSGWWAAPSSSSVLWRQLIRCVSMCS